MAEVTGSSQSSYAGMRVQHETSETSAVSDAALVDSHVHLDRYPDDAVRRMISEAAAAGVGRLLTIGTDLDSSRAALDLAGRYPSVLAAVGIHPTRLHLLAGQPPAEQLLRELLAEAARDDTARQPAAIGEVGLDAGAPDLEGQRRFLGACLELAAARDLPIVLHVVGERATHEAALAMVGQYPQVRAVAHYFVGGPELAQRYLEAGCWIAVGRPVTRPSEVAVRAAVAMIPLDRLLLETDTYPMPGRTTEPRDVAMVCAAVASLMGRSFAEIAAATTANFATLLGSKGDHTIIGRDSLEH